MLQFKSALMAALFLVAAQYALAQSRVEMPLQTHAEFCSAEVKLAAGLDPQVFVLDKHAHAAVGPQGITHVDGVRNALVSDVRSLPIYDAHRRPLHMTLGEWLSASGNVTLIPDADGH